jgi:non-heme chloroperoxidase
LSLEHAKIYPGGSHGLATTRADEFNADLLEFIQSGARYASMPAEGARSLTH